MNLLVTGGAGFIGSNFIKYVLKNYKDDTILCLDKLTYAGNISTLKDELNDERFTFVRGDICDRELVDNLFKNNSFDAVINFAAESHVDKSIENPEVFLRTNIIGVEVLMDAAIKYGNIRFHQISTDEVYGDLPLDRKDLKFTEDSPIKPSSPYSSSKASSDLLVMAYVRTYGLNATISRCSNNYGPYQFPEKLIPLMTINALNGIKLPVYGEGKNVRDWIHVEDHCRAVDLIVREGTIGSIYNIGGNFEKSNIDVVNQILEATGKSQNLITFVEDRKGHDLRYAIDASKIEKELGFKARVSFDEGIKETIKWYISNRNWWEEILNDKYIEKNNEIL